METKLDLISDRMFVGIKFTVAIRIDDAHDLTVSNHRFSKLLRNPKICIQYPGAIVKEFIRLKVTFFTVGTKIISYLSTLY